jgi:DeoR/GlpR family transcriptional regulator of sugar metabolism
MMLGADVFAAPPPAIIQTATDGETVYGLAYPVFMPEARVNDQLYVTQAIPAGELTEITVKLDEAFLSICQQGTVDVVSIVCDRVASVGGRVEDDSVVLEIQPLVKNVNRVIVTVSGVQYDRTERFRTPTNSELNAIITEEAKKADNTFNY